MKAVNLLPSDLRGALKAPAPVAAAGEPGGGSGAYVALGALALCVVALAGYVLTTNTIKQHQADLAAARGAQRRRHGASRARSSRTPTSSPRPRRASPRCATSPRQRFDWEQCLPRPRPRAAGRT